jgi:predicted transcriptional regulator
MRNRPSLTLRGFKPGAKGVGHVLGDLETAVMEVLWDKPQQTVTEVERRLQSRRDIAHTTVLTTLDRLHRKGYLLREKRGKAFLYTPRLAREEFERGVAEEVLSALLREFRAPALSAFVDLIGEQPEALDRLDAMIRQKRSEHRSR